MAFPELRQSLTAYLQRRRGEGRLRQLVLVTTAWRVWHADERYSDCCRALRLLLRSVAGPEDLGQGDSWCAAADRDEVAWERWARGKDAAEVLEEYVRGLEERGEHGDASPAAGRLRILCDPVRARHLLPEGSFAAAHWTELDVRFLWYAGECRVHFTFGFWATPPPFVPADVAERYAAAEEPAPADFERLAEEVAERRVAEFFAPVVTRVGERDYAAPRFWVLALDGTRDPVGHLERDPLAAQLVRSLLRRGVGDSGVAQSVVDGSVLALRRFGPEPADGSVLRPVYLLVPRPPADADADDRRVRLESDLAVRETAALLTEIEARVAAGMHDLDRSLNVWKTHVEVYDAAAQQASLLWDALALHMPVGADRRLADTHRAIELVHQTLLQGVADIAYLVRQVDLLSAEVDQLQEDLGDLLDRRLAERPLHGARSLREAFLRSSHLGHLRRLAENVRQVAASVNVQYKDLLGSIGHAFDERRVREADVLQKAGGTIALAGALFSFVALLDFLLEIKMDPASWASWLEPWVNHGIRGGTVAGFLLLLFMMMRSHRRMKADQKIGSPDFHERYGRLLSYLRDASTMHLDGLRDRPAEEWAAYDEDLSVRFAELWDEATRAVPGQSRRPGRDRRAGEYDPDRDIARLTAETEQWTLRALLLTERPRSLGAYRLPRLTLLYRHCVALDRARPWRPAVPTVHDTELEAALLHAGYDRAETLGIDRALTGRLASPCAPADTGALLELVVRTLRDPLPRSGAKTPPP
ncbi:hypothetical protein [Actinocorallia libanotica]|uniref:Uncharacterized protein n=1 Tax=Actinocorallia libanotica TaxID=46162 RepID=A0ABN1QU57_9ACTN